MNKKRVAIFTNFSSYSEAYSLNRVVQNQIRMLVDHGYKPVVIVGMNFQPVQDYADPAVDLRRIPDVPVSNNVEMDSTFDQDVTSLEKALSSALEDVDVVLTHDIIYQPACVKHLVAAKRIAERRPDLRWLHWIHSATSPYTLQNLRPLFVDEYANIISKKFPNSFYVFFNHYSIPRIANNFKIDDQDVKIVHHPTDIKKFFKIEDESWDLIVKKDILSADVICTYPIRLDRGKQVEKVIKVISSLKHLGNSVRLIIGDFHSTGGDKVDYRDELKKIAKEWELTDDEIIWLSEQKADWNVEVPYEVISDFMRISNVLVMPSVSESYSLIAQEAGLSGVAAVMNRDFPPFRDIFGWAPHQAPFSSNINALTGLDGDTETKVDNEPDFYLGIARVLQYELKNDRTLVLKTMLRKERNMHNIFVNELEPLFEFEPKEKDG
ncbi:glycosyltransferase family 4 protein [Candidatus Dojkabacteria bacterium]|jgi:glycosyltransferase involved in cell wall biosynthesis|nr:glycosyltransferase family 4 protein [Candidatus Dojkabacteria bacterium]